MKQKLKKEKKKKGYREKAYRAQNKDSDEHGDQDRIRTGWLEV